MPDLTPSLGFTLSPLQVKYLGLDWGQTVKATMRLCPRLLRLGAYWSEVEAEPGRYDFSGLDATLREVQGAGRQVILTVGMKAPRWPEYHMPAWLEQRWPLQHGRRIAVGSELQSRVLDFVEAVAGHYGNSDLIDYWQVENEPLDPSGEHSWSISEDLLREEIALVRQSDPGQRPIIVTMWVRTHPLAWLDVGQRRRARRLLAMADVLGLDVYPSVGKRVMGNDVYLNWRGWNWEAAAVRLQGIARRQGKDTWVMEAQAEPWEPGQLVYLDRAPSRSVQPEMVVQVYQRLRQAGFGSILLWGVEHWWMRMVRHQDPSWWETMSRLFSRSS